MTVKPRKFVCTKKRTTSKPRRKKSRKKETSTTVSSILKSPGPKRSRSVEALKRLKLDEDEYRNFPKISRTIQGGVGSRARAVEILRADDSEGAHAFLEVYDSIPPTDRKFLDLEAIVLKSGLSGRRFVELVAGALIDQSTDATRMIVAAARPKVTKAIVRAATERIPITVNGEHGPEVIGYTNGDVKAMEIFGKISGMVPQPKGSQTVINMQQLNQTAQNVEQEDDEPAELQPFDDYLLELQTVIRPQLNAPAAPDAILPVNVPRIEILDAEI